MHTYVCTSVCVCGVRACIHIHHTMYTQLLTCTTYNNYRWSTVWHNMLTVTAATMVMILQVTMHMLVCLCSLSCSGNTDYLTNSLYLTRYTDWTTQSDWLANWPMTYQRTNWPNLSVTLIWINLGLHTMVTSHIKTVISEMALLCNKHCYFSGRKLQHVSSV